MSLFFEWTALAVAVLAFTLVFVIPHYLKREGAWVHAPFRKRRDRIIDRTIEGREGIVTAKLDLANGNSRIAILNEYGKWIKEYSPGQLIADNMGGSVTMWFASNVGSLFNAHIGKMENSINTLNKALEQEKTQRLSLQQDYEQQIEKMANKVIEMTKAAKPTMGRRQM